MPNYVGLCVSEEQERLEEYHLLPPTHISDEIDNLWRQPRAKASAQVSQPKCKITVCMKIIQPCLSGSWLSTLSGRIFVHSVSQVSLLVSQSFAQIMCPF